MAWGMYNMTPEVRKAICAKGQAMQKTNREKRESRERTTPPHLDSLRKEVADFGARLSALRDIEQMSVVSAELTGKTLLMPCEIAATTLPWKHAMDVYSPLGGDEVVYVGQPLSVYSRVSSHPVNNFNRYAFVPCAIEALDKLRSFYTHLSCPKLNGRKLDGSPFTPLAINSLVGSL